LKLVNGKIIKIRNNMAELMMETPYRWCLEANMRILDLEESEESWYYKRIVSGREFISWLSGKKVKPNSTPRKTDMYLEYRMYGIIPYNISPIQAGIQFGHAVVEYQQNTRGLNGIEDIYNKWASQDKTFIICNGGTTNENPEDKWYGSMQKRRDALSEAGILFAEFREPDMNNTLTAVVFLVDERVWDSELYKKFEPEIIPWSRSKPSEKQLNELEIRNRKNYLAWEEKIGGSKNSFLREFLKGLKLD